MGKTKKNKKKKNKNRTRIYSEQQIARREPVIKNSPVRNMVLAALLLPIVIGFTIATMAVSYMLVPLGVVLIVGTIVYQLIKVNRY